MWDYILPTREGYFYSRMGDEILRFWVHSGVWYRGVMIYSPKLGLSQPIDWAIENSAHVYYEPRPGDGYVRLIPLHTTDQLVPCLATTMG